MDIADREICHRPSACHDLLPDAICYLLMRLQNRSHRASHRARARARQARRVPHARARQGEGLRVWRARHQEPLRRSLEPLAKVRIGYAEREAEEAVRIESIELLRSLFPAQQELLRSVAATYIAEMVDTFAPSGDPAELIYRLLDRAASEERCSTPESPDCLSSTSSPTSKCGCSAWPASSRRRGPAPNAAARSAGRCGSTQSCRDSSATTARRATRSSSATTSPPSSTPSAACRCRSSRNARRRAK